jgi:hypothetical protein
MRGREEIIDRHGRAIIIGCIRNVFKIGGSGALVYWRGAYNSIGWTDDEVGRAAGLFPPQDDRSQSRETRDDEQAMNEAIVNALGSRRQKSPGEEPGVHSAYAGIVVELRRLRAASQLSRYRGPAPRLPSREAVSEIVDGLVSAHYPRHFGPAGSEA